MQIKKSILVTFVLSAVFYLAFNLNNLVQENTSSLLATVFFSKSVDSVELVSRYDEVANTKSRRRAKEKNINIMIVPGHDNDNSGAMVGNIKESEINLDLGLKLKKLLEEEKGIDVSIIRDQKGYDSDFEKYLKNNKDEILEFVNSQKTIMRDLIEEGKIESYFNTHGREALPEVVQTLYGINKYVNDKDFDIVMHIHFNDYPGRVGKVGKHNGFAIYVPEGQYSNAEASYDLAEKIKDQLAVFLPESSLKQEKYITEDQEYIAIGAYNTVEPISLLIEYGYIYESQFTDYETGPIFISELAKQTYYGITNYLNDKDKITNNFFEDLENYDWDRDLQNGDRGVDVLALQKYLMSKDYYPHNNNLNLCPLSGYFGDCTEKALQNYQNDNDIKSTGYFGSLTKKIIK